MMHKRVVAFIAVSACLVVTPSLSFSFGAGDCSLLTPSIGGAHFVQKQVKEGSLAAGGYLVTLGGSALVATEINTIEVGRAANRLVLSSLNESFFRGFLFRFEDLTGSISTRDAFLIEDGNIDVQKAEACRAYGVGGVTHKNAIPKRTSMSFLKITEPSYELVLDVTVVVQNRREVSEFYYSSFSIHAVSSYTTSATQPSQEYISSSRQGSDIGLRLTHVVQIFVCLVVVAYFIMYHIGGTQRNNDSADPIRTTAQHFNYLELTNQEVTPAPSTT